MQGSPTGIPSEWLIERLDSFNVEEAARYEFRRLELDDERVEELISRITLKFRQDWDEFVALKISGDALWYFQSPQETWSNLAGQSGFAIVREGTVVSTKITLRS